MNHPGETQVLRRRTFLSGISVFGFGLALGSVSLLSGCGGSGETTQLENVSDPGKAQGGMDSMKAYQGITKEKTGKKLVK
jgi:hypothetical protein